MAISFLPDAILHYILETAVNAYPRTALSLVVVCRPIQLWMNELIYRDVLLRTERSSRAFLRLVNYSHSSRLAFLATTVKSIFFHSDIENSCILPILSACPGVESLTYWPSKPPPQMAHRTSRPWNATNPYLDSNRYRGTSHFAADPRRASPVHAIDMRSPNFISPRRLSLVLYENHALCIFRPILNIPFFSQVTHLSILNHWQDWTSWGGGEVTPENMPLLTHLKLDLVVGPIPRLEQSPSRANWLEVVTGVSPPSSDVEQDDGASGEEVTNEWKRKMNRVAYAVGVILSNHKDLQVCVLILRSEKNPSQAASLISREVSAMLRYPYAPVQGREATNGGNLKEVGFDHRLVFAWEKEPFRYSYAHAPHEELVWKSAQAVMKAQEHLSSEANL
ncbi:hypothetical protein D9613_009080 [Agrocybe pediades]|uniref:Uncharacterized protein n=1 Tax=Agrocybe pediades TaxID=84607 RepID=A0A8H4R693_9AGAR|nr:hypothetical protein D9613_009080 [Agrocybe pediades]